MNQPAPTRLLVLPDFPEEEWPSMDLAAEMLVDRLRVEHADRFDVERAAPVFQHRFGQRFRNADRLMNRFFDYPRYAKQLRHRFDAFHVCDHSYAQLVHALPADRVGVFCHDLDTFQCLLDPARDPRPKWFRAMAGRILRGLQRAAIVFYASDAVRAQIDQHQLIDLARLVKAPLGVAPEFQLHENDAADDRASLASINPRLAKPYVMHLGSCIPRKRIDVLLATFAALRSQRPELQLVQVGGEWANAQRNQIAQLQLNDVVIQLPRQSREAIATLYRTAGAVLIPSSAEGFGLPVVEALACGTPVVASDLPALRETGGDAIEYAPVGDVMRFAERVHHVLDGDPGDPSARAKRVEQAARFSWSTHAGLIAAAYANLPTRA